MNKSSPPNPVKTNFPWDDFNTAISKLSEYELNEFKEAFNSAITGHPRLIPYTGFRAIFLCFDAEFAILPKGSSWNPDATHL